MTHDGLPRKLTYYVFPIQAFRDNYIWTITVPGSRHAAIVDPGDASPVIRELNAQGLTLSAILITHHHADHVGGIQSLLRRYPNLPVFGPRNEAIAGITHHVARDDVVTVPVVNATFKVLEVPGHTLDHVAYYGHGMLFCGDTVFSVGCGRLFEGSAEQMYGSLNRLAALPPETLVYCAHEYTLDNIGFAKWVEPANRDLRQREAQAFTLIDQDRPTVPSTLQLELRTNPFLRSQVPTVVEAAERYAGRELNEGSEVFATIRQWKDESYD
jgi:hydroxyacylglutathione hydrolase